MQCNSFDTPYMAAWISSVGRFKGPISCVHLMDSSTLSIVISCTGIFKCWPCVLPFTEGYGCISFWGMNHEFSSQFKILSLTCSLLCCAHQLCLNSIYTRFFHFSDLYFQRLRLWKLADGWELLDFLNMPRCMKVSTPIVQNQGHLPYVPSVEQSSYSVFSFKCSHPLDGIPIWSCRTYAFLYVTQQSRFSFFF